MKDGIYTNISNEQYNEIDAIRASFLKTVLDNPRLAWFEKMNILPKETSASMQFGTLLHEAILEPEKYNARVVAGNQSKADKEIPADRKISASNKEKIDAMVMMFNFSSKSKLINGSQKELTIITNGKKCRIDFFKQSDNNPTQILIGDLKTTSKIDTVGLNYTINNYRYVFQLAYYKKVFEEAVDRVKKGEIHSDIDISQITDIATSLLFVCTSSPFDVKYLTLDKYVYGRYNEIDDALKIVREQENKYGYDINKPWDHAMGYYENLDKDPAFEL
jgi:hypothetical protein